MELARIHADTGALVVAFVAPPWGAALNPTTGLDLRETSPPVVQIVDVYTFSAVGQRNGLLLLTRGWRPEHGAEGDDFSVS